MTIQLTAPRPWRSRFKRGLTSLLGTLAMAATAITGMVIAPEPAQALTQFGAGGRWAPNSATWLGNQLTPNGTRVYCVDLYNGTMGSSDNSSIASSISAEPGTRTPSSSEMQWLNYLVSVYGNTADPIQAAAVSALVYNVVSENNYGTDHYVSTAPSAVQSAYSAIKALVNANHNQGSNTGAGSVDLNFEVDNQNNYVGTLNVTNMSPADATGTIALTNGIFADTGLATRDGVTNNSSFPVRGVPQERQAIYDILAEGVFTANGPDRYSPNVRLYRDGSAQRTISAGERTPGTIEFTARDSEPNVSALFSPVLATRVTSQLVLPGEEFADVVTFSLTESPDGTTNEWFRSSDTGNYAPITATGTVYGPFTEQPAESAAAPAGAPVAASGISLTTSPADGPTVDYTVQSGLTAEQAGYYAWVWEIDAADQRESVREFLPAGYHFVDRFGQVVETSFTPMTPSATSQVEESVVAPGDAVRDTLTVRSNGDWLDGVNAKFVGSVYATTDGSIPSQSSTMPTSNVRLIDTVEIVATGPGTYTSPEVTVPEDAGHLVWVWSFDASQQDDPSRFPAGYTWQDDWAVPAETQRVLFEPVVSTRAVVEVAQGEEFVDVLDAFAARGQWIDGTDVAAKGTLYGPMLAMPEESAEVPSWAMIAGTTEITLDRAGEHTVHSDIVSQEAGFYTWVWEIHAAEQSAATQARIPADYSFVDSFAQRVETSITPSSFAPVSKVTKPKVALGEQVQDTLEVKLAEGSGGWLQVNRQRVPVVFHGTAYFVPGKQAPAVSNTVPANAETLGTSTITANGPGVYESGLVTGEDSREGYISWVWEIRSADQPEEYRAMIAEWADSFGLPDETHQILMPEVTTKAQDQAAIGEHFTDTAIVTGTMPTPGMDLHFELYRATKNAAGDWVCETGNLLWTSERTRITTKGEYVSPPAPGQAPGTYHWVEVITSVNKNEISRGICGLENETTTVKGPEVVTKAQSAQLGGPIADTAIVTGPVSAESDVELTFEAYHVPMVKDPDTGEWTLDAPEGVEGLDWVCELEPVFSTAGQPLQVIREGEYTSAPFTPEELGKYFWVETLTWTGGEEPLVIHRGECGIRNETSFVSEVRTQAQFEVKAGETMTDTAILDGIFPEGATIVFDAYQVPESAPRFGEHGAAELCVDDNLIESTEPLEIIGDTMLTKWEIVSPEVTAPGSGKVYWVERVVDENGEILARGECGLPNETTKVIPTPLVITGGTGIVFAVGAGTLLLLFGGALLLLRRRRRSVERLAAGARDGEEVG